MGIVGGRATLHSSAVEKPPHVVDAVSFSAVIFSVLSFPQYCLRKLKFLRGFYRVLVGIFERHFDGYVIVEIIF